jgi:hypothetical protein
MRSNETAASALVVVAGGLDRSHPLGVNSTPPTPGPTATHRAAPTAVVDPGDMPPIGGPTGEPLRSCSSVWLAAPRPYCFHPHRRPIDRTHKDALAHIAACDQDVANDAMGHADALIEAADSMIEGADSLVQAAAGLVEDSDARAEAAIAEVRALDRTPNRAALRRALPALEAADAAIERPSEQSARLMKGWSPLHQR